MIYKIKDGQTFEENIPEFLCDVEEDLADINNSSYSVPAGSAAYVIDNKTWYIKNSSGAWIPQENL